MTDRQRFDLSRALVVCGFILYIPSNFLPVMTITITGRVEPLTVMGGVWELYTTGLGPVALIALLATLFAGYATGWVTRRGGWWPPFAVVGLTLLFGLDYL